MIIPCMLYKTRENHKIVRTEEDYIQARAEGWNNHWLPEHWDNQGKSPKDIVKKPEVEKDTEETQEITPEQQYHATIGKNPVCDRGPYKGQATRQFLKWKKDNGYS